MSESLFSPAKAGPLELPNRIVMSAMTRSRAADGGLPTGLTARYFSQRASAGLVVTGSLNVTPAAIGFLGTEGLYTDPQVAAWREVTDVRFGGGEPWVTIELDDTDTLAVMAIQKADGAFGRTEASRLAALVQALGPTTRSPDVTL